MKIRDFLRKHFFFVLFFALCIIQSIFMNITDVFDRDCRYIYPLPAGGYDNTFIIYFGGFLLMPIIYYRLKNRRRFQLALSAVLCAAMAVSTGMYAYRVAVGYRRINSISQERFEINQINLSDIADYEAGNSIEIVLVGESGSAYCRDVYEDVSDLCSKYPLAVNYYDYTADPGSRQEADKMLDKYGIDSLPAFILMEPENFRIIPASKDMVQQLENHIISCADNNFYYTDF